MRRLAFFYGVLAVAAALFLPTTTVAQTITLQAPPARLPLDEQGVDLASGVFNAPSSSIQIGDAEGGLVHTRYRVANGWRHNYLLTIKETTSTNATVSVGGTSWTFTLSGGTWTSDQGGGETLVKNTNDYVLTTGDGTVITFTKTSSFGSPSYYGGDEELG